MKKQHFSLVELLTVIAIIAILAGILIPTVGAIKESGRATQALTEAKGIHLAITSFYNDHKYLPSQAAETGKDTVYWGSAAAATPAANASVKITEQATLDATYLQLFDTICYVDYTDNTKTPANSSDAYKFNKKKKKYLNPPQSYFGTDSTTVGYRDPWGRPYIIYLDTNYDEKIENIGKKFGVTNNVITDRVAVISLGKNTETTVDNVDPDDLCTSWQ